MEPHCRPPSSKRLANLPSIFVTPSKRTRALGHRPRMNGTNRRAYVARVTRVGAVGTAGGGVVFYAALADGRIPRPTHHAGFRGGFVRARGAWGLHTIWLARLAAARRRDPTTPHDHLRLTASGVRSGGFLLSKPCPRHGSRRPCLARNSDALASTIRGHPCAPISTYTVGMSSSATARVPMLLTSPERLLTLQRRSKS